MFKIKEMREAASMTQQEAADALGISRTRYSNWENEYREINLADACRLAVLFNCTLEELVEGRKQKSSGELLSSSEHDLIDAYRDADVIERRIIERAAGIDSGGAVAQSDQGVGIA